MAGLHLRVNQLLVARASSLLVVAVVLLVQNLSSYIPVPCPDFGPLAFERLDDVACKAERGEKQSASKILVCLLPRLLSNNIKRHVGIGRGRWRLALALKNFKNELAVKQTAGAKLGLVLAEGFLVPAGKDRAVLYDRLGVVGQDDLHGDLSTVN